MLKLNLERGILSNRTLAARQFKAPRQSDLGLVKKGDTDGKWDLCPEKDLSLNADLLFYFDLHAWTKRYCQSKKKYLLQEPLTRTGILHCRCNIKKK